MLLIPVVTTPVVWVMGAGIGDTNSCVIATGIGMIGLLLTDVPFPANVRARTVLLLNEALCNLSTAF